MFIHESGKWTSKEIQGSIFLIKGKGNTKTYEQTRKCLNFIQTGAIIAINYIFNINVTTDINFISWRCKTSVHTTNLHKIKFYLSILLLTIKAATCGIREVVVKKCINHMHVCKMLESICTSTMGAYIYVMLTLLGLKVIICKIKKNRNFNHLQMLLRTMSILLSFLRDPEFNPRLPTP